LQPKLTYKITNKIIKVSKLQIAVKSEALCGLTLKHVDRLPSVGLWSY